MPSILITTADLAAHLDDPHWLSMDTRFNLSQPEWGEAEYRAAHIPGALYAHLDRDLSGPKTGQNGRHPLPALGSFKAQLGRWGIGPGVQVVAYDQGDGMYAARLWWMLRALGHAEAAVLDGGWAKWQREARPAQVGDSPARRPAVFAGADAWAGAVTPEQAGAMGQNPAARLLDARAPQRYRGEQEPIDPRAGHIPGALNFPYGRSLQPAGTFRPPSEVRAEFAAVLGATPPEQAAAYCGSGVTACHLILAAEYAGLPGMQLYPGSWSEWVADPSRPIAKS